MDSNKSECNIFSNSGRLTNNLDSPKHTYIHRCYMLYVYMNVYSLTRDIHAIISMLITKCHLHSASWWAFITNLFNVLT